MSSWSKRRKFTYSSIIVLVLLAIIGVPAFYLFYKAPTCSDGMKNGDEQGVDCGGSCQRLCPSAFLTPSVSWSRFEQVAPGLYNVASYIINPNMDAEAVNVPYHFALYDKTGMLIVDHTGTVTLPPHRNTLAFQPAVSIGKSIPAKALFEFTQIPDWHKRVDPLPALIIADKKYLEDDSGSSLTVTLKNSSVNPIDRLAVYAVLYDKDGNALGFSKTIVDEVPPEGTAIAPFTWPVSHKGAVISIEVLPVAE